MDYVHFYGDFDTVATDRHWYRREVRVVPLGRDIRSYWDAQGFRAGGDRRPRARGHRRPHVPLWLGAATPLEDREARGGAGDFHGGR